MSKNESSWTTKRIEGWRHWARRLKLEIRAIYLACKDPKVPWYGRLLAACVVGYAFSPIDLIPDPIPILGYVDDLILIPLGVALTLRMIPAEVMAECREKAKVAMSQDKPTNWIAASVIIMIWVFLAAVAVGLTVKAIRG